MFALIAIRVWKISVEEVSNKPNLMGVHTVRKTISDTLKFLKEIPDMR